MKYSILNPILSIENLSKIFDNGFCALKNINLEIQAGEILALLGPNGAGKTTLISVICGIQNLSSGKVRVAGKDIIEDYRFTRSMIGIVPQELSVHAFESVWATIKFSRGLYGKKYDALYLESLLKSLSLWDKKDQMIMTLSGGMKRRVLIAKALAHEPSILFLDEPTAGVDVELRKDMWNIVKSLKEKGVTIILTTHYIEEAEEMADRIAIINNGNISLVDKKTSLMQKLGKKEMTLDLKKPISILPASLKKHKLSLSADGRQINYTYNNQIKENHIIQLLEDLKKAKIPFKDLSTKQSSLEEIFVKLVQESK